MLFYPQLTTGAVSQFPATRRNERRTVVNALADGSEIRMSDSAAASVSWTLTYSHLTADEALSIQQFFEAAEGRRQTFTFLDPTDNLLNWSEDLSQPAWEADPLLRVTSGGPGPFAGRSATLLTNTAQISQQLIQKLAAPGWYQYCLSLYLKNDGLSGIELVASDGSSEVHFETQGQSAWARVAYSFQMSSQAETLSVGLRLPAGGSASVFGLQLEAQVGAGGYQKTRDRAGLYPKARFVDDALQATATGWNQFGCVVRIVSNVAG